MTVNAEYFRLAWYNCYCLRWKKAWKESYYILKILV